MAARLSESTELSIPLKNIVQMDISANSEFRVRWPRGELGSLPADARQDLLIDSLQTAAERLDKRLERVDDLQVRVKLVEQKIEDSSK